MTKSDVLLHRVRPERTRISYRSIDRSANTAVVFHRHLDLGAHCGAIGLHANQAHIDPIIVIARIPEHPHGVLIRRYGAANLGNDVFVPIPLQIRKCDAVPFVQFARAGRSRNIHEVSAIVIPQQNMRHYGGERRRAHPQIHIQKAIVVYIAKISPHRHEYLIQPHLCGYVLKCTIVQISIELEPLGGNWKF